MKPLTDQREVEEDDVRFNVCKNEKEIAQEKKDGITNGAIFFRLSYGDTTETRQSYT